MSMPNIKVCKHHSRIMNTRDSVCYNEDILLSEDCKAVDRCVHVYKL